MGSISAHQRAPGVDFAAPGIDLGLADPFPQRRLGEIESRATRAMLLPDEETMPNGIGLELLRVRPSRSSLLHSFWHLTDILSGIRPLIPGVRQTGSSAPRGDAVTSGCAKGSDGFPGVRTHDLLNPQILARRASGPPNRVLLYIPPYGVDPVIHERFLWPAHLEPVEQRHREWPVPIRADERQGSLLRCKALLMEFLPLPRDQLAHVIDVLGMDLVDRYTG